MLSKKKALSGKGDKLLWREMKKSMNGLKQRD